MHEQKNLLLARLQEVGQIHLDRVTVFMSSDAFRDCTALDKDGIRTAFGNASAALGRHTFAVLGLNSEPLKQHVDELIRRFDALSQACGSASGPKLHGTLQFFREKLEGLI